MVYSGRKLLVRKCTALISDVKQEIVNPLEHKVDHDIEVEGEEGKDGKDPCVAAPTHLYHLCPALIKQSLLKFKISAKKSFFLKFDKISYFFCKVICILFFSAPSFYFIIFSNCLSTPFIMMFMMTNDVCVLKGK